MTKTAAPDWSTYDAKKRLVAEIVRTIDKRRLSVSDVAVLYPAFSRARLYNLRCANAHNDYTGWGIPRLADIAKALGLNVGATSVCDRRARRCRKLYRKWAFARSFVCTSTTGSAASIRKAATMAGSSLHLDAPLTRIRRSPG
jgi:hypothetical protein